jgi:gamma-glutamylcysteine synthetase
VGLVPVGVGLDPLRPARRQLRLPRYEAMAEFLGEPYGALMMCSTASIQVNLDLGERPEVRWARANLLGPVLTAAFANSPLSGGRPCGWMSGRQAVWENLDTTRTAPVPASGDPAADWARYLLDARLMLVREGEEHYRPVRDGSTFRDWLERTDDRTPGRAGERAPQREGERTPAQAGERMPQRAGERAPQREGERTPAQAGERMPQRAGERAPQRAGERTPVQAGERTPQRADERTPVQAGERTRQRVGGRMSVQAGERALGRAGEHASMRAPTWADLAYHATTIFPPVRPRGWLEIRYLDAQNPRDWPVCVAVTHALVTDDRAADAAMCAAEPLKDLAPMAARCGLADPRFARAADACFRAAIEALPRLGASTALVGEVAAFADRYVTTGRSPAADLLDLLKEPGRRLPAWLIGEGRA